MTLYHLIVMNQSDEYHKAIYVQIEGLMMDIAAAEEEITRWKVAAEQEAAAGTGVEQEFVAQVPSQSLSDIILLLL